MDCFAALAMTARFEFDAVPENKSVVPGLDPGTHLLALNMRNPLDPGVKPRGDE
jgi:hypothetical protein